MELASSLDFSPDDRFIACRHWNGFSVWDTAEGLCQYYTRGRSGLDEPRKDHYYLMSANISSNILFVAGDFPTWRTEMCNTWIGTVQNIAELDRCLKRGLLFSEHPSKSFSSLTLSPDGKLIAFGTTSGEIKVWDLTTKLFKWGSGPNGVSWANCLEFSHDNRQLAASSKSGEIWLFDTDAGRVIKEWVFRAGVPDYLKFTDDRSQLSTNLGALKIKPINPSERPSIEITLLEEDWVAINGVRELWLPRKSRPMDLRVKDGILAMLLESGEMFFIEFVV